MNIKRVEEKLIIEIDLAKGTSPSASGKMELFNDIPKGFQNINIDGVGMVSICLNAGTKKK